MKKQGFTLIELLVVISIIGLLSSIVYTSLQTVRTKAKIAAGLSFSQSLYHVLGAEAVGVWNFEDDITDGQTSDGSGNGNSGTIYGNPVQEDSGIPALRQALKFDGVDDYVNAGNRASLDITGAVTIEAWIYPENLISTRFVAGKLQTSSNYGQYYIDTRVNGVFGVWIGTGANQEYRVGSDNNALVLNQWQQTVATFDGANTIKLYVNGVLIKTDTGYTGTNPSSAANFIIGSFKGTGNYFDGGIDEVRIYRQAITSAQIQKHYAEGLERFTLVKN